MFRERNLEELKSVQEAWNKKIHFWGGPEPRVMYVREQLRQAILLYSTELILEKSGKTTLYIEYEMIVVLASFIST